MDKITGQSPQTHNLFEEKGEPKRLTNSEWVTIAFYSAFWISTEVVYLQRCLVVTRLGPRETAAMLTHVLRAHSRQRLLTCHSVVKTTRSRKPDIRNYIRYTAAVVDCVKQCQVHGRGGLFIRYMIQTQKRLKRALFIKTKQNTRIFGVIPSIKLVQNHT